MGWCGGREEEVRAVEEGFCALVLEDWRRVRVREAAWEGRARVGGREGGWMAVRRCAEGWHGGGVMK